LSKASLNSLWTYPFFAIEHPDYVIAVRGEGEEVSFPVEGLDGGSISTLTIQIG
jgi:hypothetical protein